MTELPVSNEPTKQPEFTPDDHLDFVNNRLTTLGQRAQNVIGYGLIGTGAVFTLTGIGDFFTGGKVSEFLMQSGAHHLPEVATWAAQHLANMPLIIKTAGGVSMISTGGILRDKSRR